MAINTTLKVRPTGDANPMAGSLINDLDFPTGQRPGRAFETLRAAYSKRGHSLHRTDPADGQVTFWVERSGRVRHLPTIEAAQRFLEAIGGRL